MSNGAVAALNDDEITNLVGKGMSFLKIGKLMHPDREGPVDVETLQYISNIAGYMPTMRKYLVAPYISTETRLIPITLKYVCPTVVYLENVLSEEECNQIIELAKPRLEDSRIQSKNPVVEVLAKEHRKSQTAYLNRGMNDFVSMIDKRCSEIMHSPVENGESLQVVKYEEGGEYKPHYDYFRTASENESNRVATLLMYLNDVQKGGETYFPGADLTFPAVKGSAVYFSYVDPRGCFDPQSLHGGMPVLKGNKWIVTKWARNMPYTLPEQE